MDDQPRTTEPYPDTNTRSIYLGSTRLLMSIWWRSLRWCSAWAAS